MTDANTRDTGDLDIDVSIGETMAAPSVSPGSTVAPSLVPSLVGAAVRVGGRYEIVGLLGEGGMGTVYRARDCELDEMVALKVLRRELVDSPEILARFRQEAKLARRVTHRNVARTFDIGEHEGEKFLTMELIEGESLANVIARRGRLPILEIARIVDEVCAGMAVAHAASVIHRDLKPDNVLVANDGRIVVTDFGIAHATAGAVGPAKTVGGIVGTPAYMAPEQVEAATDIDARADLYALGAMIFELLTGERPWPGDAPFAVAAARLIHPPPDPRTLVPTLPEPVALVVLRCMAKDRNARFATAELVAAAFKSAASLEVASPEVVALAPSVEKRPTIAPTLTLDKTIAVLPFKNGGPKDDEYLADGVTDDLIDVLSMTAGVKVRPRGAVAHLRGVEIDPRKVGHDLGVQVVVEGSVRRTPTTVRVSARLVSTSDAFQIWAKRFERPAADVLALNDEVAHAIASALTVAAAPIHARAAPTNPEAVDLYLRATHHYYKFWRDDVVRAVELYEQALALAPNDATILAACARARVRVAFFGGEGAREMQELARASADRAVAGAPEIGESWTALASARMMVGDAPGAVRALRTALEKTKGLAPAHDLLGRILIEADLVDEGMKHLRTARSIDPSDVVTRFEIARVFALIGRWDESSALVDLPVTEPAAIVSRFLFRLRLSFWRGVADPALDEVPPLGDSLGMLANPHAVIEILRTREVTEAVRVGLQTFASATDAGSRRRILFFQLNAEIFAYTFEVDLSLEAIGEAIATGLVDLSWMDRCPVLAPVRQDARFAQHRAEVAARAARVVAAWTA